ncbi:MAG: hypothetical protein EOP19_24035 [Hyphomicrobiales bacterium]|nr:MAG: hypothetical protein EOP19_24035 [Hyphomicrobiales bacterium]
MPLRPPLLLALLLWAAVTSPVAAQVAPSTHAFGKIDVVRGAIDGYIRPAYADLAAVAARSA